MPANVAMSLIVARRAPCFSTARTAPSSTAALVRSIALPARLRRPGSRRGAAEASTSAVTSGSDDGTDGELGDRGGRPGDAGRRGDGAFGAGPGLARTAGT